VLRLHVHRHQAYKGASYLMSINSAYQEVRIAYLEELSQLGFGDPCMGQSYYWNPYVKPHTWDEPDKWSSKARLWAMGWLECEDEEKIKRSSYFKNR
jgi:hypothetical protein